MGNEQIAIDTNQTSGLQQMSTVISFIIPLGFLVVPIFTTSIKQFGLFGTLQVTCFIGFIYNGLQFVPSLPAQLVTVAIFTWWRAFLFSIIADFNANTFGILKMGKIQGVCLLAGAIVNVVQAPLVSWSVNDLHGDFKPLLLIEAACAVPLPFMWLWLQKSKAVDPEPANKAASTAGSTVGSFVESFAARGVQCGASHEVAARTGSTPGHSPSPALMDGN